MQKYIIIWVAILLIVAKCKLMGNENPSPEKEKSQVPDQSQLANPTGSKLAINHGQTNLWHRSTLTGNWSGSRDSLNDHGVSFYLGYKADNTANLSGGIQQTSSYLHNIDVLVGFDFEKLMHWNGATILFHAISNNGGGLSKYVGDAQYTSDIDVPRTTKLYQAWLQQKFMRGRLSFLLGLYDLNSEFYVTQSAAIFLNRSFSVGKEFSQTGLNGPSVFPNTSAAFRVQMHPSKSWVFQFAVLDAVPGNPDSPSEPSFYMSTSEGALVVSEVSFSWKGIEKRIGAGKYTLGAWFYTSSFNELATSNQIAPDRTTANNGLYFMAEQNVYEEPTEGQGLTLFSRLGLANGKINKFDYNWSFGLSYTGLFEDRDADKVGVALTIVGVSNRFESTAHRLNIPVASSEMVVELTYRARLTQWLVFQPDVQRIIQPGANLGLVNATIFTSRIEIGI